MFIPFATQSYKSRSLPVSAQRCINMFAEQQPPDAKTQVAIFSDCGLEEFTTCGTGPVRGFQILGDLLYLVSGDGLYRVSDTGTATLVGGPISGNSPVQMSNNGFQLIIVNGEFGYVYDTTNGFQIITNPNFYAANTVTFFDSYFVFDKIGTNQFFLSGLLDGLSYSALDFASAEVQPDYVVGVVNQQENLLVFGKRSVETWYDAGNIDFPFARYDGATIERGCVAPLTIVKEDNSVFFLGDDLIYYRLNGIIPVRISTHAIEQEWTNYETVADAVSFSFTREGHKFLVVNFPTANRTWVFDIATNLWHERVSYDSNGKSLERWRGNCYIKAYGLDLVGDRFSGKVGKMVDDTFTEFGNVMKGILVGPVINKDRKRVFMNLFELDMETGVGVTTGQGSDPQIMLDYSDDGGRSFNALQLWQTLGKLGEFGTRVRWLRMGSFYQRVVRVTISDPVRRVIIANSVILKLGTS